MNYRRNQLQSIQLKQTQTRTVQKPYFCNASRRTYSVLGYNKVSKSIIIVSENETMIVKPSKIMLYSPTNYVFNFLA